MQAHVCMYVWRERVIWICVCTCNDPKQKSRILLTSSGHSVFLQRAGIAAGGAACVWQRCHFGCASVWMRALFFFTVYVCSNAAACVCKMVQTLVFPDQLVNHIWGKNLDSFSPSFSAAFPFPPCVFPSLLLHSSEEEKKKQQKKRSQLRSFFFCVVSSG